MRLNIHHYHHGDADQATRVIDKLDILMAQQEMLMELIDRLVQDVEQQQTIIASMEKFIGNLKHQIAEALSGAKLSEDVAAKLAAIFPTLEGNTDRIAQAIAENTAAAPVADETFTEVPMTPVASLDPGPAVGEDATAGTSKP